MAAVLYEETTLKDPRKQIRLLRLLTGSEDDEIMASMSVWDLDSAPDFDAISYTWGDPAHLREILVNGKTLAVRYNCCYALWQTRKYQPCDYIWIDSICINQDNVVEKSSQVAIMGEIYAAAYSVLACIGEHDDDSHLIEEMLQEMADVLDSGEEFPLEDWFLSFEPTRVETISSALDNFGNRAYFGRLWIVQELYMGRDCISILCGDGRLGWMPLLDLDDLVGIYLKQRGIPDTRALTKLSSSVRELVHGPRRQFPDFLEFTERLGCFDIRDKVYGTMSLVDWSQKHLSPLSPNYELTPFELALQSMQRLSRNTLWMVMCITDALEIDAGCHSVQTWALGRTSSSVIVPSSATALRRWSINLSCAATVFQDRQGHLRVDLKRRAGSNCPDQAIGGLLSSAGVDTLTKLFTGLDVSVLACFDARVGDIVIHNQFFDLVIRQKDHTDFEVVGPAVCMDSYGDIATWEGNCQCFSKDRKYRWTDVWIEFQATDEDAMCLVANSRNCEPAYQPDRLKIDVPSRQSIIRDVSMVEYGEDETKRPLLAHFVEHHADGISNA